MSPQRRGRFSAANTIFTIRCCCSARPQLLMAVAHVPAEQDAVTIAGRWASALFTAGAVFLSRAARLFAGRLAGRLHCRLPASHESRTVRARALFQGRPRRASRAQRVLFCARLLRPVRRAGLARWLWARALGLAISGKYLGALVAPLAFALIWLRRDRASAALSASLCLAGTLAVIALANLPILLDPAGFANGFEREVDFAELGPQRHHAQRAAWRVLEDLSRRDESRHLDSAHHFLCGLGPATPQAQRERVDGHALPDRIRIAALVFSENSSSLFPSRHRNPARGGGGRSGFACELPLERPAGFRPLRQDLAGHDRPCRDARRASSDLLLLLPMAFAWMAAPRWRNTCAPTCLRERRSCRTSESTSTRCGFPTISRQAFRRGRGNPGRTARTRNSIHRRGRGRLWTLLREEIAADRRRRRGLHEAARLLTRSFSRRVKRSSNAPPGQLQYLQPHLMLYRLAAASSSAAGAGPAPESSVPRE